MTRTGRIASVDLLRGLVMVLMAVDHAREYIHAAAMAFPPENLARTTAAIFFTRWITHICAPVFMFAAGLGIYFRMQRTGSRLALSRYLVLRGLWLILLEFTVVRFVFFFQWSPDLLFLLVLWALGISMIALALLVHLPFRAIAAIALGMIALHNLADGIAPGTFGAVGWLWQILHQPGLLAPGPPTVIVAYPLIPWIGVMAAGYCAGRLFDLPAERRRATLLWTGAAITLAFIVVRLINAYGDPRPWSPQSTPLFTLLSFLNTTKYPPSLAFLLMTLGPALILLGIWDRARPSAHQPLLVFGREPLVFFVLHLAVIHAIAIGLTWWRYGSTPFLFTPPPTLGTPRDVFPADFGWNLGIVYLVTAATVALMYPICRRVADWKRAPASR